MGKSRISTHQLETDSINNVRNVTVHGLHSYWQKFDIENDVGIDGMIIIGKRGNQTGLKILVQVKNGKSYLQKIENNRIFLRLNKKKLPRWKIFWKTRPDPVILIYQHEKQLYWVNLKDDEIYDHNIVAIPMAQIYNEISKSKLVRLFGTRIGVNHIPVIDIKNDERKYIFKNGCIRKNAKEVFNDLKSRKISYKNEYFNNMVFSRVGWNHINDKSRGSARIKHSLELLSVVRPILETCGNYNVIYVKKNDDGTIMEYLGVRARINFKERSQGVVQLVILRKIERLNEIECPEKKWFLSVHEIIKKD